MSYTEYFKDITDQEQLYSQLSQLVEVELAKERDGRDAIQNDFNQETTDILAKFNEETVDPKAIADHKLAKAKVEFDTHARAITEKAYKRIQKLEAALKLRQDAVINRFNKATKVQSEEYENAVKPFKDIAQKRITDLVQQIEESIKPINEAYQARAQELDIKLD